MENITRARKAMEMSQTEFARRVAAFGLPFHQQTVQRIEAGERPIRLNEAMAICEVLHMDDLAEAILPKTAERAAALLLAEADQIDGQTLSVAFDTEVLAARAHALDRQMRVERARYVRSLASLGHPVDDDLLVRADRVAQWWLDVGDRLADLVKEMRQRVIDTKKT